MTAMIGDSSRARGEGRRPAQWVGERSSGQIRDIGARRRLAQADQLAAAVLTPLLDGTRLNRVWVVAAFLLGAIARDTLGDLEAAERTLRYALDLAEPDQVLFPFLSHLPPGPPGRHDRNPSADATLTRQTADVLAGADRPASPPRTLAWHVQALTHGETRVLNYLPTNLSAGEIADQLCLSVHTVKTHQRHLYQKLGAHSRQQAVQRARAIGLLKRSSRRL
jgi:LuxR family transcriptional regulator, maltose regulon positive regulatory protein